MDASARVDLAERVLAQLRDAEAEVTVVSSHRALTRFTDQVVHQNVDVNDTNVRVRVIIDGRTGVASTNVLDDANLAQTALQARELARFAPREPLATQVAEPADIPTPSGAWHDSVATATPDDRAEIVAETFATVPNDAWSAGYVSTSSSGVTIATSRGARLSFDGTDCAINVKITAHDSSGFAERYSTDVAALNGQTAGTLAAEKARASANPRSVEPGDWTVILEPAAFGELIAFLASHFGAQSYAEGSSFLSGRLGEMVMAPAITIRDDFRHPLHPDMPFDWEGSPKTAVTLIDRGRANAIVTDRAYAQKLARHNTGHGLPAPNAYGPHPSNLIVEPGSQSLEDLIASTKRGLLVTRLWYVRTVDQRRTILTGMTRDGTFLIEDGRLCGGVRNLRFNQSLVDALGTCALSNTLVRTGGYAYSLLVPAVKFDRFTFASGTEY
jgi:PmbA protein